MPIDTLQWHEQKTEQDRDFGITLRAIHERHEHRGLLQGTADTFSTFLYWSRRERISGEGTEGFLPLHVSEAPHRDGSVSELITPTGWRIVLARPVELGRLIHMLR